MADERASDRLMRGHSEILPNGQHRWVPDPEPVVPPESLPDKLSYMAPDTSTTRQKLVGCGWASLGFLLGGICGLFGALGIANWIWGKDPWNANPVGFLILSVVVGFASCFVLGFKRWLLGGFLLGAAIGLFLMVVLMMLAAGMRHG